MFHTKARQCSAFLLAIAISCMVVVCMRCVQSSMRLLLQLLATNMQARAERVAFSCLHLGCITSKKRHSEKTLAVNTPAFGNCQ